MHCTCVPSVPFGGWSVHLGTPWLVAVNAAHLLLTAVPTGDEAQPNPIPITTNCVPAQSISLRIVLMVSRAYAFLIRGNILPEGGLESLEHAVWRV